jgi:hypothetical protein
MLELVHYDNLIKGQLYYLKHDFLERTENLIYDGGSFFKYPDSKFSFQLHLSENTFYRYITNEEYLKKVKEKYDAKCLDIVLKRLIDESFEWV